MRSSYWLVIGAIVAGALAIAFWPSMAHMVVPSPPGQYRLHAKRPAWHATPSVGLYRPRGSKRPQDSLSGVTDVIDAKQSCGFGRVRGRGRDPCTLPTVDAHEHSPQYSPTLLMQENETA
jgi:hypothetical protein